MREKFLRTIATCADDRSFECNGNQPAPSLEKYITIVYSSFKQGIFLQRHVIKLFTTLLTITSDFVFSNSC